jgi:hypothetical protein
MDCIIAIVLHGPVWKELREAFLCMYVVNMSTLERTVQ